MEAKIEKLEQQLQRHEAEISILKLLVSGMLDHASYAEKVKAEAKTLIGDMRAVYANRGAVPSSLALKEEVLTRLFASMSEVLTSQSSSEPPPR